MILNGKNNKKKNVWLFHLMRVQRNPITKQIMKDKNKNYIKKKIKYRQRNNDDDHSDTVVF